MILVVDYGMGNIRSVTKALEKFGAETRVSSNPSEIKSAQKLVLPGVGAFGDAIEELQSRNLFSAVVDFAASGKPLLGICLGLQLLFEASEESPKINGLGILKGRVVRFTTKSEKVPHMGWNSVSLIHKDNSLLAGVNDASFFYFVHTYFAAPAEVNVCAGECTYAGQSFPAIVASNNIFATQFHPEKSQSAGLQILKNFVEL